MKLQKLTIHNIASIEDAVVDFEAEPLAGSDVFLITGKTGSGKSTILDAICLALFADTPRLDNTEMQDTKKKGVKKNSISIKDTRQLMRRNTGEAFAMLTFVGNNRVHYEAKWEVRRAHDKADGNLQPKNWTLTNTSTGLIYDKDNAIRAEIDKAVGLTFDQFCRTTLLAQGEFTRFLNSGDKEKADILEKVTGNDIYKKIGKKVSSITGDKETELKIVENSIKSITSLSDTQVTEKKARQAECEALCQTLRNDRDDANKKLQWLKDDVTVNNEFNTADNNYKEAKKVVDSDEFKAKELLVKQWNDTISARGWLTAQEKAEKEKTSQQGNLNALKTTFLDVLAGYAFVEQKQQQVVAELNKLPKVDADEEQKAKDKLEELRKRLEKDKTLQGNIKTAAERIKTLENERKRRQAASNGLEDIQKKITEKKNAAEDLEQPIKEAKQKSEDRQRACETQKEVNDVLIQLIRQKVHEGDTCPVCGQTIKGVLPHEEELTKLYGELNSAYEEAKKEYDELVDNQTALVVEKKAYENSYQRDKDAFDTDTSVDTAFQRALEACKECGIGTLDDTTPQQLQLLDEKVAADITKQEEVLPSLKQKVEEYSKISNERNRLALQQTKIQGVIDTVKQAVEDVIQDMPDWNALKPAAAVELPMLSQKANEVRGKVHTAVTLLSSATTTAAANEASLKEFLGDHPEFTIERLVALNAISQSDIAAKGDEVTSSKTAVETKKGLFELADENLKKHLAEKPALKEEDTQETLAALFDSKDKQMNETAAEIGSIKKELENDAENKDKKDNLIKEQKRKDADYKRWARLDELIGSATGDAFNRIAQSYILGSLVHSANRYMKSLYDRYTLKVEPGTFVIMVEDAYQGFASRAASTISGGESFLVSLALALALSDIGDKLAVDTLFIDEGFGTLSGEPLQNAIDTLRKLQSQSGRHVGIISHVEELQERIPVQIQVIQEGNSSSSQVRVVP